MLSSFIVEEEEQHGNSVVYYVPMQQVEDGMLFYTIRKEQVEALGLDEESLFKLALTNTRRYFPLQFMTLEQAISQFALEIGIDFGKECDEQETSGIRKRVG